MTSPQTKRSINTRIRISMKLDTLGGKEPKKGKCTYKAAVSTKEEIRSEGGRRKLLLPSTRL